MRVKIIILMVMMGLFVGCNDDVNETKNTQSSLNAPQPSVENSSIRPPKPPSI